MPESTLLTATTRRSLGGDWAHRDASDAQRLRADASDASDQDGESGRAAHRPHSTRPSAS